MSGAILHEADQRPRLTKVLQDPLGQREVLQLVSPADVVNVPRFAVTKHVLDGCAVIEYRQPVTTIASIPIERQRLIVNGVGDTQRDEFLRVLVRTIRVASSSDEDRQPVRAPVAQNQQISSRLAG